ncbi:SagB-type dehydrogenase domain protein [compost metagenome]
MEASTSFRLGRIFQLQRQWAQARHHFGGAAAIAERTGDLARASDIWTVLAEVCEAEVLPAEAERWHRKAIAYGRQAGKLPYLVQHLGRLADLLLGQPDGVAEARALIDEALAAVPRLEPAAAQAWAIYETLGHLAVREAGRTDDAGQKLALEAKAAALRDLARRAPQLFATLAQLDAGPGLGRAVIFGRIGRCLQMAEQSARAIAYTQDALAILGACPGSTLEAGLRGAMEAQLGAIYRACGDLPAAKQAFQAALAVAETSADVRGQANCLAELATIAALAGHPDALLASCQAACRLLVRLREPAALVAALVRLGGLLQAGRQGEWARHYYDEAVRIGHLAGPPEAVALAQERLAMLGPSPATGDHARAGNVDAELRTADAVDVDVTLIDEVTTDFGFGTDLLVDGWRERKVRRWPGKAGTLNEQVRPMLRPCTRTWVDEGGVAWLGGAVEEPVFARREGCIAIRRVSREIGVAGSPRIFARLMRAMDGEHSIVQILNRFSQHDGQVAAHMLAAMIDAGVVDISGRAIAQLLHAATKKGVLPGGGLEGDDILALAMDGHHRSYPEMARVPVSQTTPECLRQFHALTRARRSRRDFAGVPMARNAFDALLDTACGVTGVMQWKGRQSSLRAYPSSGGLYAVEVYAMALQIEGLAPAVYHYRAEASELERVKPLASGPLFEAMLPVEREMVSGAAVMFCLTGCFPRHEHKYGQGGYRMLVAEAGHISQSLVLAATALGLSARPFGGVFDDLVNEELGLDTAQEQFLLGVLVGQAPLPA